MLSTGKLKKGNNTMTACANAIADHLLTWVAALAHAGNSQAIQAIEEAATMTGDTDAV